MLEKPWWVQGEANDGLSTPTYSYARSNPINITDPDGRSPPGPPSRGPTAQCTTFDSTVTCCLKTYPLTPERCVGEGGSSLVDQHWKTCLLEALAAYEHCISQGHDTETCLIAMDLTFAACLARAPKIPKLPTPLNTSCYQ